MSKKRFCIFLNWRVCIPARRPPLECRNRLFKVVAVLLLWSFAPGVLMAQENTQKTVNVKIRIIEETSHQITPAMVCITGSRDGLVRVPPNALVPDTVSAPDIFYTGIDFKKDKNWIGPIRKTNGMGNEDNRSTKYELLPSIPYWKEPAMYQTSGEFTIALPAGKWHIGIEHGNEFIPVDQEINLSGNEKQATKTFQLKRWIDLPHMGWYSGDVHVHHPTNKPEFKAYLLEYAKAEDVHIVNVLAMGNHLGTAFKQEGFGEKFRECRNNICLVSGQEDPRGDFGHVIGLNISHLTRDTAVYNYYDLVLKQLHLEPGAIVGYAHFALNGSRTDKGLPVFITSGQVDFVELLQFSRINTRDYYDYLNLGFHITAVAGSDFPWGSTMGEVRTFVYTGNQFSVDAWFEGLKSGHTFVSNGPALFLEVDGKLPGTEVIKSSGSSAKIKVKAISNPGIGMINRIAIYDNDGLVAEKINDGKRDSMDISLDHILNKSEWIAAVVNCDNGAVAHTTPVYMIVNGQPTWDAKRGPELIRKQIALIEKTEEEEKGKFVVDEGILKRLESAREYYNHLLKEMNAKL
jgi:hypothetical protein